jgi:hypothetical protein
MVEVENLERNGWMLFLNTPSLTSRCVIDAISLRPALENAQISESGHVIGMALTAPLARTAGGTAGAAALAGLGVKFARAATPFLAGDKRRTATGIALAANSASGKTTPQDNFLRDSPLTWRCRFFTSRAANQRQ